MATEKGFDCHISNNQAFSIGDQNLFLVTISKATKSVQSSTIWQLKPVSIASYYNFFVVTNSIALSH
jgi:hypothetical protein